MRAFLAFHVDVAATRRAVELETKLRAACDAAGGWKVSWVPPPNLHVTLKFFGDIDDTMATPIRAALEPLVARRRPPRVQVRKIGSFPLGAEPRVLWLGIEDRDAERGSPSSVEGGEPRHGKGSHASSETSGRSRLAPIRELAREIDERLASLGFPAETRPFHPHLTLGRVKQCPPGWRDTLARFADADAGAAAVTEVVLFRSDLSRAGAEYHALARMPFAPRRDDRG